eukprot:gb/GFBE01071249.1/.p1 GENE.gb/GFBE01071249.1/~~gb/GFBE01071249.1/.p1  ORF type:complete len:136 (+),score=13.27 gb/GFBE01071249.1/:1-408(+)
MQRLTVMLTNHPDMSLRGDLFPPGAIGPTEWLQPCPTYLERLAWIMLDSPLQRGPTKTLSEVEQLAKDALREHKGMMMDPAQPCGQHVKLIHFPGRRLKLIPFVQWLLRWWSELGGNTWNSTNFRSPDNPIRELT